MNKEKMNLILDKIKEYNKIIICRHKRPDGDCVGASYGLKKLIVDTFKDKEVKVIADDKAEYLSFLGNDDDAMPEDYYKDALIIVVDTSDTNRISNKYYDKGSFIVRIDHHIDNNPYGDISWVEEEKSSVCEMIAEFYSLFKDELVLSKDAATCIYTGIITDSGRFRFNSTNGDTLRNASVLLDANIDTDTIYANLYLKNFNYLKLQADIFKKIKMTESGVAYIYINKRMQRKHNLTSDEASNLISCLDSIKGSLIWIAFIDNTNDDSIRVRLRSRFLSINNIAEHYNGGGHAQASGAIIHTKKEMLSIVSEANEQLKQFKENNTEWL